MTAAALRDRLQARGVRLSLRADGRLEAAPGARLTDADRALVREQLGALKGLLRAEEEAITLDVPDGPCPLCRAPLAWIEDWPTAGAHRWICLACAAAPMPSMADVYVSLTD